MGVGANVEFVQAEAPVNRALAEAMLRMADAFAKGDARTLGELLTGEARATLETLVSSGAWSESASQVEAVRIIALDDAAQFGEAPEAAEFAMAIQDSRGSYVLGWTGEAVLDEWSFDSLVTITETRTLASEWDGVSLEDLTRDESLSGELAALFPGLDAAILQQLQQMGVDPASLDPDALEAMLAQMEGQLPPEVVEAIRALIAQLRAAQEPAPTEPASPDGGGGGRTPGGAG